MKERQRAVTKGHISKVPKSELPEFTEWEIKIIRLTCRQYKSREIAEEIGLQPRTVESYKETILRKMKVKNAVGMALFAVKNEMVKL
jgi:DNA-binding NarL/FixJ family response regulator